MKTYFCVVTSVDNSGCVTGGIVDKIRAEENPGSTVKVLPRCDIWTDWFESREEAQAFLKKCRGY